MSARNGKPFSWFGEPSPNTLISKGSAWEEKLVKPSKDIGVLAVLFILLLAFSKRKS